MKLKFVHYHHHQHHSFKQLQGFENAKRWIRVKLWGFGTKIQLGFPTSQFRAKSPTESSVNHQCTDLNLSIKCIFSAIPYCSFDHTLQEKTISRGSDFHPRQANTMEGDKVKSMQWGFLIFESIWNVLSCLNCNVDFLLSKVRWDKDEGPKQAHWS